ncbi:MAG TPA: M3 family oligoendopeptidase [Anaerolineae bacterium]|nr:M3 family oligoendopeptidase [Anaerolineae bacterium]
MNKTEQPYKQKRWSLQDLFSSHDSPELEKAFKETEKSVTTFEAHRPELNEDISPKKFVEIIRELETITKLLHRIDAYASLWFTENTQNQAAQSLIARVEQFNAELSNRLLFFSLWWKDISNDAAQRLMSDSGDYRYWLEEMRHFKPYTLSEPEEKIINIKDVTGSNALVLLYDAFTNRYIFKVTIKGEEKEVTRGELMTCVRMPDANLRARAYQELYRVYGNDGAILGQMYQTLVRDCRNEQINLRGYKTPISARNLANDIPDEVVDTLLEVCQKNAGVFQRFFKLKARWLGIDKLRRYDVYAPVGKSSKTYSFDLAADMILDSFNKFDPRFAQMAGTVFTDNHIDSEVRKGKLSGAFCATVVPELTPWVLTNYQGRAEDVATLAHELGHAIHAMLASHHSQFTQNACLPLAETASTFGEMMLIDRMLEEESDESVRRDILFRQVDDSYATIMRQAFFALFEKQVHDMILQGASVDEISNAYFENLKTQFGNSLEIGEEFQWEWVSIPHIYHVPFYVYAYAFGQLLVLSLYKQFKDGEEFFKPHYISLLSTGGSEAPMRILDKSGIDARKAEFWQSGFNLISGLISQLEELPIS